jgi:hypothetical protein
MWMPVATQRGIATWAPADIYMQYFFDLLGMFYDVYISMLHAVFLF